MLMLKILQNHLLCAFVANLKIGAFYALYPESFCDKNLAIRKVFAFCDSGSDQEAWALCSYPCMHTVPDQCVEQVKANLYYATRRYLSMFVIAFKF